MQDKEAHCKPIDDLVKGLQTDLVRGLSQGEAQARIDKFGAN